MLCRTDGLSPRLFTIGVTDGTRVMNLAPVNAAFQPATALDASMPQCLRPQCPQCPQRPQCLNAYPQMFISLKTPF